MTNARTSLNLAAAGFAAIANNPACPKEIREFALENFAKAREAAKEGPIIESQELTAEDVTLVRNALADTLERTV